MEIVSVRSGLGQSYEGSSGCMLTLRRSVRRVRCPLLIKPKEVVVKENLLQSALRMSMEMEKGDRERDEALKAVWGTVA